jgi:hypothetical protein
MRLVFVMAIVLPEGKVTAPHGDVSVIPPHVIYDKEVRPSLTISSLPTCSQGSCPVPRSSSISQDTLFSEPLTIHLYIVLTAPKEKHRHREPRSRR